MTHLTVIPLLGLCFTEAKNRVTVSFPPQVKSRNLQSRLRSHPSGTICGCCLKSSIPTPLFNVFGSNRKLRWKRWRCRKAGPKSNGYDDTDRIIANWRQMRKGVSLRCNSQSIDCVLRIRGGWREETKSGPRNEEQSRRGSTGDTTLEHGELGGCEKSPQRTAAASSVSLVVPRSEKLHVDAKEEKMRAALLAAEGPNKILREVERIPALRRLSDSALRVTSATASDGRLAALALYRLGAAARTAETAVHRPLPSPEVTGSAAETKVGPVQRVEALPSSSVDTPSPVAASKGSLESDVDAEISLEGRRGVGIGVAIPEGSSNVDCASKATFSRDAEGESARNMGQSGDEFNILQRPGEGETTEEHVTRSETETMQQARDGGDGGDDLDSLASSPAPAATFDIESVKGDQRFEQLVEIVECVASGLSVSDISKVVWGLSVLGHLPRNSLMESLATILADRLRGEWMVPETVAEEKEKEIEDVGVLDVDKTQSTLSCGSSASTGAEAAGEREDLNAVLVKAGDSGSGCLGETCDSVSTERRAEATPSGGDAPEGRPVTSGTDLATAALSFAYAHARLDVSTGELLEVLAACVVPQLTSMPLRDLANIAWAFAMQRLPHRQLLEGIAREVNEKDKARQVTSDGINEGSGKMTAKEASILAWSFGALGLRPAGLYLVLARKGLATVHEATAHDLSNLAWGLARIGVLAAEEQTEDKHEVEDRVNHAPGDGERIRSPSSSGCHTPTTPPADCSSCDDDASRPSVLGEDGNDGLHDYSGEDGSLEGGVSRGVGSAWGFGWVLGKKRMTGRHTHETGARHKQMESRKDAVMIQDEGYDIDMEAGCETRRGEVECDAGLEKEMKLDERDAVGAGLVEGVEVMESQLSQRLGEAVLDRASECFRQFLPKQLSRLCWALGSWHSQGVVLSGAGPFAARALTEAGHRPKDYIAEELAQVLWAFATLVGNADSPAQELAGLLGALAEGFESEVAGGVGASGMDPITACDVLWSFAKLGYPAHSLCEAIARHLVDQVQQLPPSSIATLTWAYAKMGHPSAELMERALSVVERRLNDFSVEDATNALWALGALGYTVSLKRQFDFSRDDLRSLNPSATANLLWGLAKTGAAFADGFDREALEAVADDMGPKLLSFSPRELCRTAWALGRLGIEGVFFGSGIGDVDEEGGNGAVPEGDMGDSGGEMPKLMDKLLGECSKWLELFTPQELETLLWTVCRLEHRADDFVADMAVEAKRRQDDLPELQQQLGPSAVKDAAFHLGSFRHLLGKYRGIDFDGQRARGRYRRGKSMLSRMFRER